MSIELRNTLMRAWLRRRDLFNTAAICRTIDYDRGAFARFLAGYHDLKEDTMDRLEKALAPYGYNTMN